MVDAITNTPSGSGSVMATDVSSLDQRMRQQAASSSDCEASEKTSEGRNGNSSSSAAFAVCGAGATCCALTLWCASQVLAACRQGGFPKTGQCRCGCYSEKSQEPGRSHGW